MQNTDLTKILNKEHEEKWVALTRAHDKVVDYDEKLVDLRERLGRDNEEVVYFKVPRSDTAYAF